MELNSLKYELLHKKAVALLDFRNRISKRVCTDIDSFMKYALMDKNAWITHFRETIDVCSSQDIQHSIRDVHTDYKNKIEAFNKNLIVKIQDKIKYSYYKKNTKTHKMGEVLDAEVSMKSTPFTKCVSYLIRYWNDGLIEFLRNSNDADPDKQKFRNIVLTYYDKYPERIRKIVLNIRNRVVQSLIAHPIAFTSLTYNSCNELKDPLLKRNVNHRSTYGAMVILGAQNTIDGKLYIPVKHNKEYHGKIKDYHTQPNTKGQQTTAYTVIFTGRNKIRIVLTKEIADLELKYTYNYLGVDVNIKHNLFCDSDGNTIDFDRDLFNDYVDWLKKMDAKHQRKKSLKQTTKLSIKDSGIQQRWVVRIKDMLKCKSNKLVKSAIEKGIDHIVMEDLGDFARSFTKSEEFNGFKYSRLVKMLNLADLKNIVTSIANKHNLNVSFIQPHYTSKGCECGNISNENRKTQEEFICTECGICMNADHHSAIMIKDRVADDVLKAQLLNKNGTGYKPKILSKAKIKTVIHDHYTKRVIDDKNFTVLYHSR